MSKQGLMQKKPVSNSYSPPAQKATSWQRPFSNPVHDATVSLKQDEAIAPRAGFNLMQMKIFPDSPAPVQAKPAVSTPGDHHEREADIMASQVMKMSVPENEELVQQQTAPEEQKEEEVQTKPLAAAITPLVQRETTPEEPKEEDSPVQAKAESEGKSSNNSNLESQLNGSKGGGSPLSDEVRAFMEPRFGADFSGVRVHTDGAAVQMNKELGAQAFAHGSDIYYGGGKSPGKDALTAHELTHVVQQTGGNQHQQSERDVMQLKPNSSEVDKKAKPFTVAGSGEHITLTPKKPNGKTLYFFFGYTGSKKDQEMRDEEASDLEDDVYRSAAQGFKVVYDKAGSYSDFFGAIYDPNCYGVYWSGHGYMNGNIQSSDGKVIRPEDVDVTKRSTKIAYLILAACGSGLGAKRWQKTMGTQCQFEGWVDLTNTSEAKDFTSSSWFDSWSSHKGMNQNKELADYINDAEKAK